MSNFKKITGLLFLFSALYVEGAPSQDFSRTSLCLEYKGLLRGQYITEKDAASHESIHMLYFHYAPAQYVVISVGFGAEQFSVEPNAGVHFQGNYGFSPSAGLSLFSPFFFYEILRISCGATMVYLNSEDNSHYVYRGPVVDPYVGFIFSAAKSVDLGIGCRGHLIFGKMENTQTGISYDFSNRNMLRGYASFTLHSPAEGAFLTLDCDLSPKVSDKWVGGPLEASLGISVGAILRAPAKQKKTDIESSYFPAYKEMKEKRKKMAEEIE
jgi:hypothetical protein